MELGLYTGEENSSIKNLLTTENGAKLISALTGKKIGYKSVHGTEKSFKMQIEQRTKDILLTFNNFFPKGIIRRADLNNQWLIRILQIEKQ